MTLKIQRVCAWLLIGQGLLFYPCLEIILPSTVAFVHLYLNNAFIFLVCLPGRWRRATGPVKRDMPLFLYFCGRGAIYSQGASIHFWQEDQVVELCLLVCFSTRVNSGLSYSCNFYLSKYLVVHYWYLSELKLFGTPSASGEVQVCPGSLSFPSLCHAEVLRLQWG